MLYTLRVVGCVFKHTCMHKQANSYSMHVLGLAPALLAAIFCSDPNPGGSINV
jgi:hypothetical protein